MTSFVRITVSLLYAVMFGNAATALNTNLCSNIDSSTE